MTPPRILSVLFFVGIVAGSFALIHSGTYGLTLFVVLPVAIGALASLVFRPHTGGKAVLVGAVAALVGLFSLLAVGAEGLICIAMAAPLAMPLGGLGGWLAYSMTKSDVTASGAAMLLLVPSASVTWDVKAKPTVFEVHSSVEVAASPERVWNHVVTFSELPPPREFFFRAGIAYPLRARIEGSGPGAVRYCEFSTGPFVEPIETWDEPRLLQFRVSENPAPMDEWSPYAHVLPKHLHGYLISKRGQFKLTPLPNGHTLLEGSTWYQHGLWPGVYWRWWSEAIIHRIHMRVLNHIKLLTEAERRE